MKRILISVAVLLLLSLSACTSAGDTQSSGVNLDYNAGYQLGYRAGFRDGAQAGFNQGRFPLIPGEYETFGDWFYSSYPQYR